ncbi:pteridine reductase [Gilvimarinus sp. SDUM040013]|uniref:Pteridine reductase n=1 Tax=Gilvimarinus gilvus TaxID=3058038 RepID=A0ABU4RYN3_9GAMM|nr:pteridine reductase [Gilvimarinus sp. SDUM040013]MDO3385298.1 pteridine reductase [Gilvimarinus sp. SDUM040013]MDX6849281.1 pteridine reductase [Gilvimarinus sp. SDUM040013]
MTDSPVALITGGARRIGAAIARKLHSAGWRLVIHCHHSLSDAEQLAGQLNSQRAASVNVLSADLCAMDQVKTLADSALTSFGQINALINNASSFYPTAIGEACESQWDDLIGSNLKAPFFLSQHLTPALTASKGCIVNIADIHAERPLKGHSIYCIAKAGNVMLTKTLARELAPDVRVNGIAPGAIAWPEDAAALSEAEQSAILQRVALGRTGEPDDIARTVAFLLHDAPYISGQIIAVDGGRTLQG